MDTRSFFGGRNAGIVSQWKNGKCGKLLFSQELSRIQFIECEYGIDGNLHCKYAEDCVTIENCPSCACGIVAHIIWHREGMGEEELYRLYYTHKLSDYIQKERQKPGAFKRDLNKDFYMAHYLQEKENIVQSGLIWAYLGNEEKGIVMKYVECYFDYLAGFLGCQGNNQGTNLSIPPKYFTCSLEVDEIKQKYNNLINRGYISKETQFNHFRYWFTGGVVPDDLQPIHWIQTQSLLTCLVNDLFGDLGINHWEIAKQAFQTKGHKPNIKTMKKDASDFNTENKPYPKGYDDLKTIILG